MSEQPLIALDKEKILSLANETQFAAHGIVSRTLMKTANARVVLFGFAAGQELSEHTSPHHAMIQILSGECEFALAGVWHALKTGDLLYMPPHLPHAVKAPQQFSMLLTLFKAEAGQQTAPAECGHKKMPLRPE
jgi:quercetin dioxygenase-like cupin family protein